MKDELIEFLKSNRSFFRMRHIEGEAGVPLSTINHAMKGTRQLSDVQKKAIASYLYKTYKRMSKLFDESK